MRRDMGMQSMQTWVTDLCRVLKVADAQDILRRRCFEIGGVEVRFAEHDFFNRKKAITFYLNICKESDLGLDKLRSLMAANSQTRDCWGCFAVDSQARRLVYKLVLDLETPGVQVIVALQQALAVVATQSLQLQGVALR